MTAVKRVREEKTGAMVFQKSVFEENEPPVEASNFRTNQSTYVYFSNAEIHNSHILACPLLLPMRTRASVKRNSYIDEALIAAIGV
jgi:hypothetical protein